jgi:hypothetical protein
MVLDTRLNEMENEVLERMKGQKKMSYQYVYIKSEQSLWTVGFYNPNGEWNPESDHGSTDEAAKRVNYLNGGAE